MSDAIALEQEHGDFDIKARVVWILYVATILLGVTSFVGVVFAYIWRSGTPDGSLFKKHFDGQISLFWTCLIFGLATVILFIFITSIFAAGMSSFTLITLYKVIVPAFFFIVFLGVISYFVVKSLVGLMKAFGNRPYY